MLLQAFRYIFFVNTMDRAVLFQIQSNLISFLRRITYKWNKCIFILFLFGPLGIRVAAQVETDDSFLPIGMWAGISGTKNYLLQFRKKCFLVPDCLSLWNWWEDRGIYFSSVRLFYVYHAGSSCKCILCPLPISFLFYWQQCLVKPINQFPLNVSGMGCPNPMNCVLLWVKIWVVRKIQYSDPRQAGTFAQLDTAPACRSVHAKLWNSYCTCFSLSRQTKIIQTCRQACLWTGPLKKKNLEK